MRSTKRSSRYWFSFEVFNEIVDLSTVLGRVCLLRAPAPHETYTMWHSLWIIFLSQNKDHWAYAILFFPSPPSPPSSSSLSPQATQGNINISSGYHFRHVENPSQILLHVLCGTTFSRIALRFQFLPQSGVTQFYTCKVTEALSTLCFFPSRWRK